MKDFSFWKEYEGTSEGSGRSEKIWLQNPDTGQTGLFKFKKDVGTTDHISECIAYKIAKLLEKGERDQCEELFPVFSSRLPDKKRKDIKKILEKYKLEEYDSYELLKRSGAKLPIDNLQFIDPILDFEDEFEKKFYVTGVRHYLGCEGEKCTETLLVTRGDEVFLEQEKNNQYDKNAIRVVNEQRKLLGYVPRYYAQAFNKFIEEKRIRECHVVNVEKENCCDECICVLLKINELKD